MRVRRLIPALLLAFTAATSRADDAAPGTAPTAGAPGDTTGRAAAIALIDRVLWAYGGPAKLARVHAYRLEGRLFASMRHVDANVIRVYERPGRFKTLIEYPEGAEARVVDGAQGWHADHGGAFQPAPAPMLAAMGLQAARAGLPWVLAERESLARMTDPLEHEGVKLDGVQIPLGEGQVLLAWVDPLKHLVRVSRGLMNAGGMSTSFETDYSDYRAVGGLQFAFHEESFASGMQTGVTTVEKMRLDPPLRADEFAPPAAAADTARAGSRRGS